MLSRLLCVIFTVMVSVDDNMKENSNGFYSLAANLLHAVLQKAYVRSFHERHVHNAGVQDPP